MPKQKNKYLLFRRFVRIAKEVVGLALLVLQLLKLLFDSL
jgi:hypothetical protein